VRFALLILAVLLVGAPLVRLAAWLLTPVFYIAWNVLLLKLGFSVARRIAFGPRPHWHHPAHAPCAPPPEHAHPSQDAPGFFALW
jgi:hypothetical protein